MDISELKGRWVLEAVNGRAVAVESGEIFFMISNDTISGYDGCNRFGGSISQPYSIRKTQRDCPAELPTLPLELSDPLRQLGRATVTGDKLTLPLPDGTGEARFRRGG